MAQRTLVGVLAKAWKRAARGVYDAIATTTSSLMGGYQALDPRRKILPRGYYLRSESANELASMSLPQLRALCRKLERDNPTARAAVEGLVAQVVGTGIALEPDHGDEQVNKLLRSAWHDYLHECDITGSRSIYDLQAQAFREVVLAGEFLWRTPVLPERADRGLVPLVVLPLECEWLAIEPRAPLITDADGITAVAGIELDKWGRPVRYHLSNPEFGVAYSTEKVGAGEIIHGFERRRALQNRGEPWLTPVIERIWQEGDLVDAELRSAINCAAMALVITSDYHEAPDTTEQGTPEDPAQRIAVGAVARMFPGEDVHAFSHNRPAQQIAAFRQTLRGDIAAACRMDQRWLDKDYSRANYSSLRAAMIDADRLLAPVREWFGQATIGALYRRALPFLCIQAGVEMPRRVSYRLVPDGQAYVDPLKDAQAAAMAIAAGLSTADAEIGKRGGDRKAVWKQLALEEKERKELGLSFDLSTTVPVGPDPEPDPAAAADGKPIEPKASTND
jgi:lambda family phage portal protein